MMRSNGFQRPLNWMQVSTWILLLIFLVQFTMCCAPVLPLYLSIVTSVLFYVFGICTIYFGGLTSTTDSIDDKLYEHLNGYPHPRAAKRKEKEHAMRKGMLRREEGKQAEFYTDRICVETPNIECLDYEDNDDDNKSNKSENYKHCWICQTEVHKRSMHCKFCNKCVSIFDHHCKWLNTCVGEANYQFFYKSVMFTFLFMAMHSVTLSLTIIFYFVDLGGVKGRMKHILDLYVSDTTIIGINIGFLVGTLVTTASMLQLFMFHIELRKENITTYQWIVRDSQLRRDRNILEVEIRKQRTLGITDAKTREGNVGEIFRLWMYGWIVCKRCDPLRRQVMQDFMKS